jgi:hypothetical protein
MATLSGSGSWTLRCRANGKQYWKVLGHVE